MEIAWRVEGLGGAGTCCWSGSCGGEAKDSPEIWSCPFLLGLSSLFPSFQFLLEMEGATAGAELGLFRCLLCAWETPSRLAVLQHLRAPAHRDAQAQRRLQLLQSGPAAEEGLSALHSILSFSHGQLRTPGEGGDWREGAGQGGQLAGEPGADEKVLQGRRNDLWALTSKWGGAVRGDRTGSLEQRGCAVKRLGGRRDREGQGLCWWRTEQEEVKRNHPVIPNSDSVLVISSGWGTGVGQEGEAAR